TEDKARGTAWPVVSPLPAPQGLRPCCAFGYDLHAPVLHMQMPFYELDNVVTIDSIGEHRYNDSLLLGLANLAGIGHETNGLVYTARGGFIDTGHVCDHLRCVWMMSLRNGMSYTPHTATADRYALAAWIAAPLAIQIAAWHEIEQWYGFESVPGSSEEASAFSPEDLSSNLLGARIAVSLILNGQLATTEMYDAAMNHASRQALKQLGAKPE
ncbi:DUF4056 domain-containing protein, partial [Citrobacter portucalensis]|uniref:DUF4056 domain-containing protein n=1 Tax=Citrobacter portucalensis TaxID=1639133 RepID=UPI001782F45D